MLSDSNVKEFRRGLLTWFDSSQRDLPWRRTRDPYAIWVSEIMLQQTRVAAAIPYFERFITRFPGIEALASSSEQEMLSCWAGLGYYYRARNMRRAAILMRDGSGFPRRHEELLKLPGIGEYTAAAIASIAFDEAHAAVDGNVIRVASRIFNDDANSASVSGKKHFAELASQLLDRARPGAFNQAMMELGATICLPGNPRCLLCPVGKFCEARRQNSQHALPVKSAKTAAVEVQRRLFWIAERGNLLVWQRPAAARLMPGFWELPEPDHLPAARPIVSLGTFRHSITFHKYTFEVCTAEAPFELGPCQWMSFEDLANVPVSTIFKKAKRIVENQRAASHVLSRAAASTD